MEMNISTNPQVTTSINTFGTSSALKTQKDNERISKITEKYSIDYDRLISIIKALPPHFKNTRETIIKALEEYLMRENLIMAYENEKFYKTRIL